MKNNTYYTKTIIGKTRGFNHAVVNRYTKEIVSCWSKMSEASSCASDLNRKTKGPKFEIVKE